MLRSSHLDHSLRIPMTGSEFNILWSRLRARTLKYNSIRLNTVTKMLLFFRVKIRSVPSLFFARTLVITVLPVVQAVFNASSALLPGEYINMVQSSSSLAIHEVLHCRLTSKFLRIAFNILRELLLNIQTHL